MRRRPPAGSLAPWWRFRLETFAIGVGAALAQLAPAQAGAGVATGGPGWITAKDEQLRERFRQLLLAVPTNLPAGWQLASDLGRPAAPVLWELLQAERGRVENRLVLLAAAMLAGGHHEDDRLFAWLDQQKPMLEERTLAAMLVALGPMRTRPVANFWPRFLGGAKTPEQLLAIAVRLASVRFPGSADGAPVLVADDDGDPGLAAATAFAGLPVPGSLAQRLWSVHDRLREPSGHAGLFWRGVMLAAARRAPAEPLTDATLERARELMQLTGDELAAVRGAAAWVRAVAGDLRAEGSRINELPLLRIAAANLASAERLRPWLTPRPQPRDVEPQRLAVAYALSRPPQVVVDERQTWAADASIARHVAIALAWRLAGTAPAGAPVDATVPDLPEWAFVVAASGGQVERGATCDDPRLAAALALLANGRLDRAPLRALLENTLWRWGSHPHLAPWELERAFVRDLLLAGAHAGGPKYQPNVPVQRRYFPSGLDRGDEFFTVAVALYEFLLRPRAPIPPQLRLPE